VNGALEEASVQVTDEVEHCVKTQSNWHRRMDRRSIFYIRRMITRDRAADSVAQDEPTARLV
jgi:hypothetical protein